ncbi:DNA-binding CsgD family transcriptional regulator [Kutzneria kofuensis]|uniref:DNA-binding CsgD family transcriptional regulator n=1 Tax=Kutzneria kofuensis TaxID=103725 RepID=A0A7W9KEY0_9PSEU|nr:DNA-binding CsgD family transcriptional regulator [Kutzneria kofuensis]
MATLVTGAVGTGKTELLHAFGEQAARAGALVLSASGSPAEDEAAPLDTFYQLFHSVGLPVSAAARAAALLSAGMTADGSRTQPHVLHGLTAILLELAEDTPLAICVDDVEHSDAASLECLLQLIRKMRKARISVALTQRTGTRRQWQRFRGELQRQPHVRYVRLTPLSADGVGQALADQLGTGVSDELAATAFRLTGGNPLLVRALVRDSLTAVPGAVDQPRLVTGTAYQHAVLSCLHGDDKTLSEVARSMAVLGAAGSTTLVARLAEVEHERVSAAVGALAETGLLDGCGFRHPAMGEAVLADVPGRELVELHGRAARLLWAKGMPAITVAEHLVAVGAVEPAMAPVLREAAEQALGEDRVELAGRCLELAADVCDDKQERASVMAALMELEWWANHGSTARRGGHLSEAISAGHLSGKAAGVAMTRLLWQGRAGEAKIALDQLAADGATSELRLAELTLATTYPGVDVHVPAARGPEDRVVPTTVINQPRLGGATALAAVLTAGMHDEAIASAEHLLQNTQLTHGTADSLAAALMTLIYADRLYEAAVWCDHLLAEAKLREAPGWEARFAACRAEVAFRQGELAVCESNARLALERLSAPGWGVGIGFPLANLILAATEMGRHEEAAYWFNQPVPQALLDTRFGLHYLHARGHYQLSTGRLHAALGEFLSCGELMAMWGIDRPTLVPWRSDAAQVYLRLGEIDKAQRLLDEQLALLPPGPSRTRGITLCVKARASGLKRRRQLLREAVDNLQAGGGRLELARAQAELADVYQALDEPTKARTLARKAWHMAKTCQADALCQILLPDGGLPKLPRPTQLTSPEALAALTDAERRVAKLAALGQSNREIAGQLYITVSTVEQHLTRVYRKLKVSGRSDLPSEFSASIADTA